MVVSFGLQMEIQKPNQGGYFANDVNIKHIVDAPNYSADAEVADHEVCSFI